MDKDILECICIPSNLCTLSKAELDELRDASTQNNADREDYLLNLERSLEEIDKYRAEKIESIIADYNKEIRKLKYLPPESVTRMLQVCLLLKFILGRMCKC